MPQGDGSKKKWKHGKHAGKKQKEKELKDTTPHLLSITLMTSGSMEMQDEYPVASSSAVTLDTTPSLLAARLEPIYESNEDSPPPGKHTKCGHWN